MSEINYLKLNCEILKYSGLVWVGPQTTAQIWMIRVWRLIQISIFTFMITTFVKGFWIKDEFEMFVQRVIYTNMSACFLMKFKYFIIFEKNFVDLVDELRGFFKLETETGMGDDKSMRGRIVLVDKFMRASFVFFSIFAHVATLMPLFFNKTSERIFPMPFLYPKICKISPVYEFTLFLISVINQIFMNMILGADGFYMCTIILICGQFDLLGWECRCLLLKASKSDRLAQSELAESEQNREDLMREFGDLIKFHQHLLSFCDRFNNYFSPVYLMYLFPLLFTMVFPCFIIIETDKFENKIMFGMFLLFGITFVFLPCFLGQILATQTETFFEELYDSAWYECDEDFKMIFKLLQFKARTPIYLTFGKFGNFSLNFFLSVMKSVVSYVTVLRQLSE